jgi:hypothetical protein
MPGIVFPNVSCVSTATCESECTAMGVTTCTYCSSDLPEVERCLRAAFPPSEVECTPMFDPAIDCTTQCSVGTDASIPR